MVNLLKALGFNISTFVEFQTSFSKVNVYPNYIEHHFLEKIVGLNQPIITQFLRSFEINNSRFLYPGIQNNIIFWSNEEITTIELKQQHYLISDPANNNQLQASFDDYYSKLSYKNWNFQVFNDSIEVLTNENLTIRIGNEVEVSTSTMPQTITSSQCLMVQKLADLVWKSKSQLSIDKKQCDLFFQLGSLLNDAIFYLLEHNGEIKGTVQFTNSFSMIQTRSNITFFCNQLEFETCSGVQRQQSSFLFWNPRNPRVRRKIMFGLNWIKYNDLNISISKTVQLKSNLFSFEISHKKSTVYLVKGLL